MKTQHPSKFHNFMHFMCKINLPTMKLGIANNGNFEDLFLVHF